MDTNRTADPAAHNLRFDTMSRFQVFMHIIAQFQGLSAWLSILVSPLAPQRRSEGCFRMTCLSEQIDMIVMRT